MYTFIFFSLVKKYVWYLIVFQFLHAAHSMHPIFFPSDCSISQSHSVPHTQYSYMYVFHQKKPALFLVASTTACCLSFPIAKTNTYSCTVSKQLRPCTFYSSSVLDVLQFLTTFWYKYMLARHTSHVLTKPFKNSISFLTLDID